MMDKFNIRNDQGRKDAGSSKWIPALGSHFNKNHILIIISLLSICSLLGVIVASGGIISSVLILVLIAGVPLAYLIMMYPKAGIIILMIAAYFIMWFTHMGIDYPFGTVIDLIEFLLILGFFIKQKNQPNWAIFKSPISYIILVWIAYNVLQILNPIAESRLVWVFTIRSVAAVMIMYFVFVYHIRSLSFIRLILKVWIALSIIGALYACWQEFVGFLPFEEQFLQSDPKYQNLLFIGGHWRKFSIFSDPVSFSYNMVMSAILCVILMFNPMKKRKKFLLGAIALFLLWTMLFSGTRGAYVLIPVAAVMLTVLKLNKQVLIASSVAGLFFATLVFTPTSNSSIRRFQSAFKPSEDASFNVRAMNQKRIQPYIQQHPFGAGLGAVSLTGKQMVRHSVLTGFAPDSGFVRVAVELGWIGLLLFCTLFFMVIKTGINNYFYIKNQELKNYCLAMTLIVFVLAIGSYPQEAIVQFPTSIYFYFFIAIITVSKQLDDELSLKETKNIKP